MSRYPYNPDTGQTDLMGAAYHGDVEEIARILAMPSDIDAQDDHGMTALMYAAMMGHTEAVQCIIEHGAALELLSSSGRYTALMHAVRRGHTAAVKVLLASKADPDVHQNDSTVDTPLTLAASCGFLPIVRVLVGAGADVSRRGGICQIPPEAVARREGHHDISEFLLYHEKRPAR
jgi:ankyrin repeat protein